MLRLLLALGFLTATAASAQTLRLVRVEAPETVLLRGDDAARLDVRATVENHADRPQTFRVEVEIENGGLRTWLPEGALAVRGTAVASVSFTIPASVLRAEARRTGDLVVEVRLVDERREVVERERVRVPIWRSGADGGGVPPADREETPQPPLTVRPVAPPVGTTMPVRPTAAPSLGFAGALLRDVTLSSRVVGRGTTVKTITVVALIENLGATPWDAPVGLSMSISGGPPGERARGGARREQTTLRFEPALAPGEIRGVPIRFGDPVRLRIGVDTLTPTSEPLLVPGELGLARRDTVRIAVLLSSDADADASDNGVQLAGHVDERLALILSAPRIYRFQRGSVTVTPRPRD